MMRRKGLIFWVLFGMISAGTLFSCAGGGLSNDDDKSTNSQPSNSSNDTVKPTTQNLPVPSKHNYNIYIDNTSSMNGYVSAKDISFQQAVYGFITTVNLADLVNTSKVFFINKGIRTAIDSPLTLNVKDFASRLDIKTFQPKGDSAYSTDIATIIEQVLRNSNNDVNVIISDFIYSWGGGNLSYSKIPIQQNAIANIIKKNLDKRDYDIIFMRYLATFSGKYYYESIPNQITHLNCLRPYFMMVIGPHEAILRLISKTNQLDKFRQNGFKQMCYFHMPEYGNRAKLLNGNYDFDNSNDLIINNAELNEDNNGKNEFQFTIAADFNNIIEDQDYFTNSSNYAPIINYTLTIEPIKDTTQLSTKGFSHLLKLKTDKLLNPSERFNIILNSATPKWVENSSIDSDSDITSSDQKDKTFGLKYVIEGIDVAYSAKYKPILFSVQVVVNKAPGSSSSGIIIFFLVLLSAAIIFFFIKKIKQA